MIGNITPDLPERLVSFLRPGAPGLLLTCGADGYPSSAYTWVMVLDAKRLRFGVDLGGSAMGNIERSTQASLQVIGAGNVVFLIKGRARKISERIAAAAPANIALYEMEVFGAKDQSWPGVATTALTYEWPAESRAAMLRMEQAVYQEMREACI
ncbi:MAG: pyridoxamine 5'-phosphate oxidase family protein [Betaproteobacteria bacterium]|nr:pyridoxamine 5'-phosphate oxidase family protein [Betaproteobacteria bacterium]